jgi:hypothetical protein
MKPGDRGATDDAMSHFVPRDFDAAARLLLEESARDVARPVICSEPLVETTLIEASAGVIIPLVNWSGKAQQGLIVQVGEALAKREATLASGGKVRKDGTSVIIDLDVADVLIFR